MCKVARLAHFAQTGMLCLIQMRIHTQKQRAKCHVAIYLDDLAATINVFARLIIDVEGLRGRVLMVA